MLTRVAAILAIAGALLVAFGYWGIETNAGRRAFDEMAGMIPWGAGVLGSVLVVVGATLLAIGRWRRRTAAPRRP